MFKRMLVVGLVLLVVLLAAGPVGRAAPLYQIESSITQPANGARVSGQVEVRGVARHPNIDFYQVRYAPGSGPTEDTQWEDFGFVYGRQVENDVLGTWDTTQLPDGQYTLALAVWGINDPNNPHLDYVTNLVVDNSELVMTPTPVEEVEPTQVVATITPGPTPTPVAVEQPPTVTPRPTPTFSPSALETPTVAPEGPSELALNVGQIRDGFCTGGMIAVGLLTVWGLYVFGKAGVRWALRQRSTSSSGMRR